MNKATIVMALLVGAAMLASCLDHEDEFTGYVNWNDDSKEGEGDPTAICSGSLVEVDCQNCCKQSHYEFADFDEVHNTCGCVPNSPETNREAMRKSIGRK